MSLSIPRRRFLAAGSLTALGACADSSLSPTETEVEVDVRFIEQAPLYVYGTNGYSSFRIPALTTTPAGTLLAFAEGRTAGFSDFGGVDILVRRSSDSGVTWEAATVVVSGEGDTAGNPAVVIDKRAGRIHLLHCRNPGEAHMAGILDGTHSRSVWSTFSDDDGRTWSSPRDLTARVKDGNWTWYATGPGHGIQLASGRLVVACNHVKGTHVLSDGPPWEEWEHAHLLLSDDGGENWRVGGVGPAGTDESILLETADGSIYVNSRNYVGAKRRAVSWSRDEGETLGEGGWDDTLIEPRSAAGIVRMSDPSGDQPGRVLFSNPASQTKRERLTIRVSYDECATWNAGKVVFPGRSGYSDLAVAPDGSVICLYEYGQEFDSQTITVARMNLSWLTDGADSNT